jgi:hypothetical protein
MKTWIVCTKFGEEYVNKETYFHRVTFILQVFQHDSELLSDWKASHC